MGNKEVIPYKRVIILGSTGFLGKTVQQLLQIEGIPVHGYGSTDLDLRKAEMLEKLDQHADRDAALVIASALTPRKGVNLENFSANIAMSLNVARYLENHPIGLCVYISSDAVYPFSVNPVSEESPVVPADLYALSKYSGERILNQVASANGIPLLVLRITALFGAGDMSNSYGPNRFIRSLMENQTVRIFGAGEEQRDHLYIDDAARWIRLLMGAGTTGTFNLASGRSCSFSDIVNVLREIMPNPFEVVALPRKAAITHRHFDISRLFLSSPGFRFTRLEDALRAYYQELAG